MRGYARNNDLPYYVTPVPEKKGKGFRGKLRSYIVETLKETGELPTEEQVDDFIFGRNGNDKTSPGMQRNAGSHRLLLSYAKEILEATE